MKKIIGFLISLLGSGIIIFVIPGLIRSIIKLNSNRDILGLSVVVFGLIALGIGFIFLNYGLSFFKKRIWLNWFIEPFRTTKIVAWIEIILGILFIILSTLIFPLIVLLGFEGESLNILFVVMLTGSILYIILGVGLIKIKKWALIISITIFIIQILSLLPLVGGYIEKPISYLFLFFPLLVINAIAGVFVPPIFLAIPLFEVICLILLFLDINYFFHRNS